jgi:hypothetical protein
VVSKTAEIERRSEDAAVRQPVVTTTATGKILVRIPHPDAELISAARCLLKVSKRMRMEPAESSSVIPLPRSRPENQEEKASNPPRNFKPARGGISAN